MNRTSIAFYTVEVDVEANRLIYELLPPPDPNCCNACATYLHAVSGSALPSEFVRFVKDAGADPLKPQEVWGAPDGGFLQGWFFVAGRLVAGHWQGTGENAAVTLDSAFSFYLTDQPSPSPPKQFGDAAVIQIEFTWTTEDLRRLEKEAWPPSEPHRR